MHFSTISAVTLSCILTFATAAKAPERKVCTVTGLGGGRDDGPNILAAFKKCGTFGKIKLHGYYSVDTLLLTTGLDDVEIDLKGTCESCYDRTPNESCLISTVQYTPDIAKWSPQSYFLTYQNASTFWFLSGNNINLYGGGTIDGNGQVRDSFTSTLSTC